MQQRAPARAFILDAADPVDAADGAGRRHRRVHAEFLLRVQDFHPIDAKFRILRPETRMAKHVDERGQAFQVSFVNKWQLSRIQRVRAIAEAERV